MWGQDGWILAKFFSSCVFIVRDGVAAHKLAKKERGQYPAILTEQTRSIRHFLYGFRGHFPCGIQRVANHTSVSQSLCRFRFILPAHGASHIIRKDKLCSFASSPFFFFTLLTNITLTFTLTIYLLIILILILTVTLLIHGLLDNTILKKNNLKIYGTIYNTILMLPRTILILQCNYKLTWLITNCLKVFFKYLSN